MKESGIDGLSRGDLLEDMMAGKHPLTFVLLNEDTSQLSGTRVSQWVDSWWKGKDGEPWCGRNLKLLKPDDWFDLHNIQEARLWIPPPAAMETVVELFNEDRLAQLHIPNVFFVPRLMTHLWRKQPIKDADICFT